MPHALVGAKNVGKFSKVKGKKKGEVVPARYLSTTL
jgi:hypothetical protein